VPLAFALGYALANGIARFSGWRYDLPADWVGYAYVAVGVAELLGIVAQVFGVKEGDLAAVSASMPAPRDIKWSTACLLIGGFMLVSALPWLAEGLAAPRYAGQNLPALVRQLDSSEAVQKLNIQRQQIDAFAANSQATLQIGRVLYPRFFTRDNGLPSSHPWPAYAVRDFPRVGFLLLNQTRHDALIPLRQVDRDFQEGADAIILGCLQADYIEVRLIVFPQAGTAYMGAPLTQACK
jgi:hypothetical protein